MCKFLKCMVFEVIICFVIVIIGCIFLVNVCVLWVLLVVDFMVDCGVINCVEVIKSVM